MSLATDTPKAVDISRIERELNQLWGGQLRDPDDASVTRACMSNLIVFCSGAEQASALANDVGTIVEQHPSRVLLLVSDPSAADSNAMAAYVSAHCHLAGGGRQICSEHITVRASHGATRRLPSAARALLIGDLPTALWWTVGEAPARGEAFFEELAAMADHVIYDSVGWSDPARGVLAAATWVGEGQSGQSVSDLAWRRLKAWRRFFAQCLDPAVLPGALEGITEVAIEYGPRALPQAWLLIGWLADCLQWRARAGTARTAAAATWSFDTGHGPVRVATRALAHGPAELRRVSVTTTSLGESLTVTFTATDGRLVMTTSGARTTSRTLPAPPLSRPVLVARQLPKLGRDALYRRALRVSRTMAEALLR